MGPARSDHHCRIVREDIGPPEREPGELSRVIVEVDAVLAPRLTAIEQLKRPPTQRVEGMSDPKGLCLTTRGRCNRQLTPIRSLSA